MKKTWMAPAVCMFLLCNLLVTANVSAAGKDWLEKLTGFKPDGANETEICLIEDGETECCLYAKDESSLFTPAGGIVLWMTAKLAAENLDLQERVEVGSIETLYGSSREIGLKEKYDLTVKDLLAATLLYGAQDAAYVLAVKTAGTAEDFVRMMNDEASILQMKDTVYKNPCGSPGRRPGHNSPRLHDLSESRNGDAVAISDSIPSNIYVGGGYGLERTMRSSTGVK